MVQLAKVKLPERRRWPEPNCRFGGGGNVLSHEGGYSATNVPYCGLAVMEQLAGARTGVDDPWLRIMERWGWQDLQPHQEGAIDKAALALSRIK